MAALWLRLISRQFPKAPLMWTLRLAYAVHSNTQCWSLLLVSSCERFPGEPFLDHRHGPVDESQSALQIAFQKVVPIYAIRGQLLGAGMNFLLVLGLCCVRLLTSLFRAALSQCLCVCVGGVNVFLTQPGRCCLSCCAAPSGFLV